jgi:hypothetical protein
MSPGRQLWQQLARRRLRQADPRPLAGLLVLHGGQIEDEDLLAKIVAADRRRGLIGLAWLGERSAFLPDLRRELTELPDRLVARRHHDPSASRAAGEAGGP